MAGSKSNPQIIVLPCNRSTRACPTRRRATPGAVRMLVLFDAIRAGSARERALAIDLLEQRLQP